MTNPAAVLPAGKGVCLAWPSRSVGGRDVRDAELPRQLPASPRIFVGRAGELADLEAAASAPIVVLTGPGGVGKTTLARRWAHAISPRFPDGQLYLDLQGFSPETATDPADALGHLLRALGVAGGQLPAGAGELSARYRTLTTGRSYLVVLDNALSAAQVRALLPGDGPSLVVVTSRQRLAGLVADGGVTVEVRPWELPDAVTLLERVLGPDRVRHERADAARIARLCDGLPFALAVVAARLAARPRMPLARIAAALAEEKGRLRTLRTSEGVSVLSTLDLSYQALPTEARAVFRRLSLIPARDYGIGPIVALTGSVAGAESAVDQLIQANLLEETAADRYRQHDLIWLNARQRLDSDELPDERDQARRAVLEWYLAAAAAADHVLTPYRRRPFPYGFVTEPQMVPSFAGRDEALRGLGEERRGLIEAGTAALQHGWNELAWHLSDVLWPLILLEKLYRDRVGIEQRGAAAARRWGNRWAEAESCKRLGLAHTEAGRPGEAEAELRRAVECYAAADDRLGVLDAEELIASVYRDNGREREAIAMYDQILAANRTSGDPRRAGLTLIRLGTVLSRVGEPAQAVAHLLEARELFRELGAVDPYNRERVEIALAGAYLALGELDDAIATATVAAAGMDRLGSRFEQAQAVEMLARAAIMRGDRSGARRYRESALVIYDDLGSSRARILRAELPDPDLIGGDGGPAQ
ncbi:tetratricopeptide repeat protein [Actinoplanes sp. NPDC049265]|uniref:tetratricopeptide repeat protein n=1 Tax=Actinoplanes sp. NPDC049265 TaxID=3363902 RepID=UPI003723E880